MREVGRALDKGIDRDLGQLDPRFSSGPIGEGFVGSRRGSVIIFLGVFPESERCILFEGFLTLPWPVDPDLLIELANPAVLVAGIVGSLYEVRDLPFLL